MRTKRGSLIYRFAEVSPGKLSRNRSSVRLSSLFSNASVVRPMAIPIASFPDFRGPLICRPVREPSSHGAFSIVCTSTASFGYPTKTELCSLRERGYAVLAMQTVQCCPRLKPTPKAGDLERGYWRSPEEGGDCMLELRIARSADMVDASMVMLPVRLLIVCLSMLTVYHLAEYLSSRSEY